MRRKKLRLTGAVHEHVISRVEQRREPRLQPVQVRVQELDAVEQRAVGAQAERVHRLLHRDQVRHVHAALGPAQLVRGVQVHNHRGAPQRTQQRLRGAAVRRLAAARRAEHQLAPRHRGEEPAEGVERAEEVLVCAQIGVGGCRKAHWQ